MTIDQIRDKLSIEISKDETWADELNNTQPGHYGVHYWEVQLLKDDIWVSIPNKTFTFKNASFSFRLQLMSSSDEHGTEMLFSKNAIGNGTFEFTKDGKGVVVKEMKIEVDLDLFAEEGA